MRSRLSSTFRNVVATAGILVLTPRGALGQACCAGANALTPARVPMSESLVTGAQASVRPQMGSWDAHGRWTPRPIGVTETDFEFDLYAGWRTPWKRLQIAAFVPFIVTGRSTPGAAAVGAGIGDLNFSARLDVWQGIAVLGGITLPSGTPPDSATRPLAVDATGTGQVRAVAGLAFERELGAWLFDAVALATISASRSVGTISETRAPGLALTSAVTHVFDGGDALGVSLSYQVEWDASVDGMTVKDSSRRLFRFGLHGLHPIGSSWRIHGALAIEPPVSELGQNELVGATLLLGVQRGF